MSVYIDRPWLKLYPSDSPEDVEVENDTALAKFLDALRREVEDVLYEHPAVREAAVVGVPDQYRGETVKAFVSPRPGQTVQPEELITFCRPRMAAYKYPPQIEIRSELPKTVTGKILRRELRDEAKLKA